MKSKNKKRLTELQYEKKILARKRDWNALYNNYVKKYNEAYISSKKLGLDMNHRYSFKKFKAVYAQNLASRTHYMKLGHAKSNTSITPSLIESQKKYKVTMVQAKGLKTSLDRYYNEKYYKDEYFTKLFEEKPKLKKKLTTKKLMDDYFNKHSNIDLNTAPLMIKPTSLRDIRLGRGRTKEFWDEVKAYKATDMSQGTVGQVFFGSEY